MKRIDLSNWKDFNIESIFPNIIAPKVYHSKEVVRDDKGIPYVVRSKYNNGIKYRVKKEGLVLNPAGVISYGAENAKFFYQKDEYVSGRDMYYIDTRNISRDVCLFLCTCLNNLVYKYSYNFGFFPKLLKKEIIKLPADENGNPDWKNMELFVHNVSVRLNDFYKLIVTVKSKLKKIDVSNWKEFKVGKIKVKEKWKGEGLFNIYNSTPYHEKDVLRDETNSGLNYVVRSKYNNGLKYKVEKTDSLKINPAKTISFGAENRDFFYQSEEYITGNKMYYIDTSQIDENACLFFINVLQKTFNERYSFSDGMIPKQIYDKTILLPQDSNGNADWKYMSNYIVQIKNKAKSKIDSIKKFF